MTRPELQGLRDSGFALVGGLLERSSIEELRAVCDRLPAGAGGNPSDDALQGHPAVARLLALPVFAEALRLVMGHADARPLVAARMPRAGFGQQGLHCDVPSHESRAMTALVYLDDSGAQNGGTRIVPATHLLRGPPPRRLADPGAHHPEERIVEAPAGAALVFDGHLWHSGTRNVGGGDRRALQIIWRGMVS
jgi:ectoine hydroxylase-related dioxygenase (phytanoyl-CoA dioxygenase family)